MAWPGKFREMFIQSHLHTHTYLTDMHAHIKMH